MRKTLINNCLVALLIVGSAISLLSCESSTKRSAPVSRETLMTESSDNIAIVVSENGRLSYRFTAPRMEGYTLAREPYREFRRGVDIITYLNDSLTMVDATLTANYGIYYSNLKLWEVKGDVVIIKHDGKELYTQQLFWNSVTKRIYSNVDTKIVNSANGDVYNGEGFESDEDMKEWSFRKMKGRMLVDTSTTERDSTEQPRVEPRAEQPAAEIAKPPIARPEEERPERSPNVSMSPAGRAPELEGEGDEQRARRMPDERMMSPDARRRREAPDEVLERE
ncbi:MAG: LPS export ABC transporter periplasmic protein LptC [Rikenellaceae bacterium]